MPSLTWGYGHSPVFKDKCYATLVVAWGPLIQLYVLNDIMEKMAFYEDGFHILQPDVPSFDGDTSSGQLNNKSKGSLDRSGQELSRSQIEEVNPYQQNQRFEAMQQSQEAKTKTGHITSFQLYDHYIERVFYLSESVLLIVTRSLEFKILYTQKFSHGAYDAKTYQRDVQSSSKREQEDWLDDSKMVNQSSLSDSKKVPAA